MPIPTPTITQTSSMVSTVIGTSPFTESMDEFEEDNVVPLGDYFYNKSSKAVLIKGKKRGKDQGGVEANQIIWTQQFGDPQVDVVDTTTALGAFTGANLDAVNTLNRELERRKEEIIKLEEELDRTKREHNAYVVDLKRASENRLNELQLKNTSLQAELQNEQTTNTTITQRIAFLENQCEDATATADSSVLSKFSQQEFKDLAIQTNQEHHELVTELFKTMDDILETHVDFGKMSVTLENQVFKREKYSKAYDDILDWQRHMKDRP